MLNKTSLFLGGFLLGAASGAVISLLNAPQSGEETRAQIRSEIAEARGRAEEALTEAQASVMRRSEAIQDRVGELIQQVNKIGESVW
jgi:gas vesicle protein